MREIKFRAWDKEEKRFWYFDLQNVLERQLAYMGSWDRKIAIGKKMQFIGLKDINGKEIFEGDILKCSSIFNQDIINVGLVEFKKGEFKIKWINEDSEVRCDISFWVEDRITEIIGNIYENKELLKALSK